MRQGMSADQIIQRGLPIRPAFSKRLPARKRLRKCVWPQPACLAACMHGSMVACMGIKAPCGMMALAWHLVAGLGLLLLMLHLHPPPPPRRQLGMDASVPAVLLVGGGEGMGALEDTVAQLDKELGSSAQVVVVCGRNQKLQERLQARPQGGKHLKVIATGEPRAGALPSACMLAGAGHGAGWHGRGGQGQQGAAKGRAKYPSRQGGAGGLRVAWHTSWNVLP